MPLFAFAIDSLGLKQTTQPKQYTFSCCLSSCYSKKIQYSGSTMILTHMNAAPCLIHIYVIENHGTPGVPNSWGKKKGDTSGVPIIVSLL